MPQRPRRHFTAEQKADAVRLVHEVGNMSQVARDAGLSRESLYKALSGERSPGFDTILKVVAALGLRLHAQVPQQRDPRRSYTRSGQRPGKRRAA